MKKIVGIALLALMLFPIPGRSQYSKYFAFNLNGGYTFKDNVNLGEGFQTDIMGGFQWGGSLEYFPYWRYSYELSYQRLATDYPLYAGNSGTPVNPENQRGSENFILLGANTYFGHSFDSPLQPFFGAGLGVCVLSNPNNSATKFGWDAKLGLKYQMSPLVGLKVQARVQSAISTFGSSYWWGYPGVIYEVPNYATIFQFNLGAGVSFNLGKKAPKK